MINYPFKKFQLKYTKDNDKIILDVLNNTIQVNEDIKLIGPIEVKLLFFFLNNINGTITKDFIYKHMYGRLHVVDQTLYVHISRLRKILRELKCPYTIKSMGVKKGWVLTEV